MVRENPSVRFRTYQLLLLTAVLAVGAAFATQLRTLQSAQQEFKQKERLWQAARVLDEVLPVCDRLYATEQHAPWIPTSAAKAHYVDRLRGLASSAEAVCAELAPPEGEELSAVRVSMLERIAAVDDK